MIRHGKSNPNFVVVIAKRYRTITEIGYARDVEQTKKELNLISIDADDAPL